MKRIYIHTELTALTDTLDREVPVLLATYYNTALRDSYGVLVTNMIGHVVADLQGYESEQEAQRTSETLLQDLTRAIDGRDTHHMEYLVIAGDTAEKVCRALIRGSYAKIMVTKTQKSSASAISHVSGYHIEWYEKLKWRPIRYSSADYELVKVLRYNLTEKGEPYHNMTLRIVDEQGRIRS